MTLWLPLAKRSHGRDERVRFDRFGEMQLEPGLNAACRSSSRANAVRAAAGMARGPVERAELADQRIAVFPGIAISASSTSTRWRCRTSSASAADGAVITAAW